VWDDIGTGTKVPLRFVTYLSKVTKINEKSVLTFDPVTASSLVKTFWVMHYKEVKFFFHNMDFMGIKRCRILCRFQKYKLTLVPKCT
jgi:hypothetical protein